MAGDSNEGTWRGTDSNVGNDFRRAITPEQRDAAVRRLAAKGITRPTTVDIAEEVAVGGAHDAEPAARAPQQDWNRAKGGPSGNSITERMQDGAAEKEYRQLLTVLKSRPDLARDPRIQQKLQQLRQKLGIEAVQHPRDSFRPEQPYAPRR